MNYLDYKEKDIKNYLLTEDIINNKIKNILKLDGWEIYRKGKTTEEKEIYALKYGKGKEKVIFWAGMHGNEHTGITSLLDFINYINKQKRLNSKFTFVIVLCLNIDGFNQFTRVNKVNIDLNRDAINLETLEGKFLMDTIEDFNPNLCVNLHDQRSIFNVKNTNKPAILSFLSASENKNRDITHNRKEIMKLISYLNSNLQMLINSNIGRYTDEFYPTAFGDNLMKKGFKNILIESGIGNNDIYREDTRKYTFLSLFYILEYLQSKDKLNIDYNDYFKIPENDNKMMDIIIRNGVLKYNNNSTFKVDIGITLSISPNEDKTALNKEYKVINIGDLSNYYGHTKIDAMGKDIYNKDNTIIKLDTKVNFNIGSIDFYELV